MNNFTLRGSALRYTLRYALGGAALIAALMSAHAPLQAKQLPQLMMILDASASMEDKLTTQLKYKLVRKAMNKALPAYGGKLQAGLITFGRNTLNSCTDISSVITPKPLKPAAFGNVINSIKPKGKSPIGASLIAAINMANASSNPSHMLLMADGSDNCSADICASANLIATRSPQTKIHVIGIGKTSAVKRLSCVSKATNGIFSAVNNGAEMTAALKLVLQTVVTEKQPARPTLAALETPPSPPAGPLEEAATRPAIKFPQTVPLPARSSKRLKAAIVSQKAITQAQTAAKTRVQSQSDTLSSIDKTIPETARTDAKGTAPVIWQKITETPSVIAEAPATAAPATAPASAPFPKTAIAAPVPAPVPTKAPAQVQVQVPAPPQIKAPAQVQAQLQAPAPAQVPAPVPVATPVAPVTKPVAPRPDTTFLGKEPSIEITLPETSAKVKFSALITEQGKAIESGLFWRIYQSRKDDDGRYKLVKSVEAPRFDDRLPLGVYLVNLSWGRSHLTEKLDILSSKPFEHNFVLNAGGLRLGARHVDGSVLPASQVVYRIYSDERDQFGKRRLILDNAKPARTIRLNAGIYHVASLYGTANGLIETDITIEAGKLTDAVINHSASKVIFKLVNKPGGEALAGAIWRISSPDGKLIKNAGGALPSLILAAGDYLIDAKYSGRTFTRKVTIEPGAPVYVELVIE